METRPVCVWWGEMGYSYPPHTRSLAWSHFLLLPTMGFPPKTFLGRLGGQPAALSQPQHGDCSPLLASGPSGPQFLMETFLAAARSWGSSTSIPPSPRLRQRPLPPPGCPCVCLPFTVPPGGSAHRSFPVPSRSPSSRVPTWRPCQSLAP